MRTTNVVSPVTSPVTSPVVSSVTGPRVRRDRAFSPEQISGLGLWIDADPAAERVLNSIDPVTVATDGQTIRRVLDRTTNERNANQTSGALQPLYETSEYSLGALRFDGSNDFLDIANVGDLARNVTAITCCISVRLRTDPTTSNYLFALSTGISDISSRFALATGITSGKYGVAYRRLDSDTFKTLSGTDAVITDSFAILTVLTDYSSDKLSLRVNTVLDIDNVTMGNAGGSTSDTASLSGAIAAVADGSGSRANADIAELLFWPKLLSASEIDSVETYLSSRWQ